jgi:phosphonate transport system substrate-binding protein
MARTTATQKVTFCFRWQFLRNRACLLLLVLSLFVLPGCGREPAAGTKQRPIKMAFVPYVNAAELTRTGGRIGEMLAQATGMPFDVDVGSSYRAVIEAMGAGKVDIGWLSPFSYVMAHSRYGVEVILITSQDGATTYRGCILTRAGSPIRRVEDLKGRHFAFVDSLSTSGTIYPKLLMLEHGVDPEKDLVKPYFAGGHDKVVLDVYAGRADAGSIYVGASDTAPDARDKVLETAPDVKQKTRIVAYTRPIPNDNVCVRGDLPPALRDKLQQALVGLTQTPEGQRALNDFAGIDGLHPTTDATYQSVRDAVQALNIDLEKAVSKG